MGICNYILDRYDLIRTQDISMPQESADASAAPVVPLQLAEAMLPEGHQPQLHWIPSMLSLQLPLNGGRLEERPGPSEILGTRHQMPPKYQLICRSQNEVRFHALWMPKRVNMSGPCLVMSLQLRRSKWY